MKSGQPVEHLPEGEGGDDAPSEAVGAKPYQYWGPLDCHCRWRAPPLRSLVDRQ